jgi:drug/metabolite transporter (DMT)-like permease
MYLTERFLAILAALGSAASWALGAVLFKRIGEHMSAGGMTLAKGIVGMILLGAASLIEGFEPLDGKTWILLIASGLIGISLGDTFFFKALKDLGAVSMLTMLVGGQILTILLSFVFLAEWPNPYEWLGMTLILLGVGLALQAEMGATDRRASTRGIAFGFAAVACMAVSLIIVKKPLESVPSIQATFLRIASGSAVMLAAGLCTGKMAEWLVPMKNLRFLGLFLTAVTIVTFGGFWLSMYALKHLDVALANILNSTEPIFALPLAFLLTKEKIKAKSIIAAASVCSGILAIFYSRP